MPMNLLDDSRTFQTGKNVYVVPLLLVVLIDLKAVYEDA
jgi:hypothetical protein